MKVKVTKDGVESIIEGKHCGTLEKGKLELDPGVRIDSYISTNAVSAVTDLKYECERMGASVPKDWIAIPAATKKGDLGVDFAKVESWWAKTAVGMNAFMFTASYNPALVGEITRSQITDANRAVLKGILNPQTPYALFESKTELVIAYKDNNGYIRTAGIGEPELSDFKCMRESIRYSKDSDWHINRDLEARSLIQSIAKKLPYHTPVNEVTYEAEEYSLYTNNCSHLIRRALEAGGLGGIRSSISTPAGLIKDSGKQLGKCSKDLLEFVSACVIRMDKNERKYLSDSDIATNKHTEKFLEFKKIEREMQDSIMTTKTLKDMEKRVEQASKMSRRGWAPIIISDTQSEFNSYSAIK